VQGVGIIRDGSSTTMTSLDGRGAWR
jgi:hypothetical protein